MLNNDSQSPCGVLYVDDEEKALKYFRMAFSSKFTVFTATSGSEGMEVLRREREKIGIVLSDQRMPEMLGAEFLGMVREAAPNVVRILTTAYSDLDSAIQAVNQGHIYQYVVKPWEIPDLGMVLQRAADYHQVLTERDALLSLKLTTLQRVICSDRLKWLLLQSGALAPAEQWAFRRAILSMIKTLPANLLMAAADGAFNSRQFDITDLILGEYRNAARCVEWLAAGNSAEAPTNVSIEGEVSTMGAVPARLGRFLATVPGGGANVHASIDADRKLSVELPVSADDATLRGIFGLLTERETPECSIRLLELLTEIAAAEGSLALVFDKTNAGDAAAEIVFSPHGESGEAEQVIRELYERFAASDISRM